LEEIPFLATFPNVTSKQKASVKFVFNVPDRASIHRKWGKDVGQYLEHVQTEAAFGACDWNDFLSDVP
jgi:hypothetical protein